MQKTLGGDRLGSGKKQKVDLHGYERSTHDMGYLWRSTMAAGTLVPFMCELALPGDTFDINLDCDIKTHPTIGPLFGSYKVQLDVFQAPIRLYQGQLHNNKLGIGMNMANVKLPQIKLYVHTDHTIPTDDPDNAQINPSCILSYLNIRGIGYVSILGPGSFYERSFNAIPLLAYWDTFKNYYANKQEPLAYVVDTRPQVIDTAVTGTLINIGGTDNVPGVDPIYITAIGATIKVVSAGPTPIMWQIIFETDQGDLTLEQVGIPISGAPAGQYWYSWVYWVTGNIGVTGWRLITDGELPIVKTKLQSFDLSTIDNMREKILSKTLVNTAFDVNTECQGGSPYDLLLNWPSTASTYKFSQQGLAVKTYQSDLFNNWLSTEWIDGAQGINEITAIDTSSGSFNIDTLNLSKKVYDMLNRIAVSGGSYDDWLDAVYTHDRYVRSETPIYHGGLIKELIFQEVISNSESAGTNGAPQPLGTLAGRGILAHKHKGGRMSIKIDEPSYLMGIISITPRVDYSQGNKWDTILETMDDLHKPALDEIGFQELITEQMAWFSTEWDHGTNKWIQKSAGKQPAWINYMTNVNQTRGNFAIKSNEMFMTLNRRYEYTDGGIIKDVTTYIDPAKYNQIFAETSLDSQNFWAQIAVDITARRKMSAKVMPNL